MKKQGRQQRRVPCTIPAIILILLLLFLPLISQAQGPVPRDVSMQDLPGEMPPGALLRDPTTAIPGLESRLAVLYNAERTGNVAGLATLAGERHIDLQNHTARVVLEMDRDPGAQPAGKMTVETITGADGRTAQIRHAPPVAIRPELEQAIAAVGATYETAYGSWVQVLTPIASLEQLTHIPDVGFVRLPYPAHALQGPQPLAPVTNTEEDPPEGGGPQAGASTTQGVALTNAASWHTLGYDGTGVNLAVYDFGFTGWQARWLADDLSRAIVLNDWSSYYNFTPDTAGFEHGTACAEIAYDMAPDTEIHLYAFGTDVEFANAVGDYRYNVYGKRVVSMSIGWVNAGPYDGTGEIASIVNNARWSGIFWANAAGNEQGSHYSSTYRDYSGSPGSHQWTTTSGNVMTIGPKDTPGATWCFNAGTEISLYLEWNDWDAGRRRNAAYQDYDLGLVHWDGSAWSFVATSTSDQCSTRAQPLEAISYIVPSYSCDYGVYISAFTDPLCPNSKTAFLDLYSFTSAGARTIFTYNTECNSLCIPADADGAVTVGATFWGDDGNAGYTYGLEPFSSLGPRNAPGGASPGVTVSKPDVVAPDGVDTISYGLSNGVRYASGGTGFWGTSAAAPHVAGMAATIWEAYPNYTLDQLRSYVQNQSLYKANGGTCGGSLCGEGQPESATQNNRFGWGRINLAAAPAVGPITGEPAPICMDDPMSLQVLPDHPVAQSLAASPVQDVRETGVLTMTSRELAGQPLAQAQAQAQTAVETLQLQPFPADIPGEAEGTPVPNVVASIPNVEVGKGHAYFANNESYASVDTDADGNIYVAFEVNNGDYDLGIAMSADNGKTWDIGILDGTGHPDERYPSLAVDDSGFIWVGYSRNSGSGYHPAYAVSVYPQDIRTWLQTAWTSYTGGALHPTIDAVGSDLSALVFLAYEYPNGAYTNIAYNYTLDGGTTWNASWTAIPRSHPDSYPTVALGYSGGLDYVNIAFHEEAYGRNSLLYLAHTTDGLNWHYQDPQPDRVGYADLAASGANVYLAYQYFTGNSNDDVRFHYSTNGGETFSAAYVVADGGGRELYPAVSASGSQPRVVYYNGDTTAVYLEIPSANYGAAWANAPYPMDDATNAPSAPAPRNLDVAYRVAQHPAVVWSADPVPTGPDNLYYSTINDPPTAPAPSWPAAGAALQTFAPSLSWTASSNADGDAIGYWWYMDTSNPPGTLVGGPVARTASLPNYTAPGVTYYWQVVADDGYQTTSSVVRSFTTGNDSFSGSPLAYTEDFTTDPITKWTRHGFACVDCFESDSGHWMVSPPGKWGRSDDYAWDGLYSAQVLYDANYADYLLTSSALDLRGATWAYFNSHLRGSSEPDFDYLMLESRADGASPWVLQDARSGHYNAGWWKYYEGNIDLSAYAGTTTGQVRFHFYTDELNYGSAYGFGWYEDRPEVSRESEWAWRNVAPLYYRLQTQGAWLGYTNYLVDYFYSPYILLPNNAGSSVRLTLTERYNVSAGDRATIWIFDTTTGAWQMLTYYNGVQGAWTDRTVNIPDSYKGKRVVFGLILQSDGSGALGGPEETGGYWDVDRFHLEEYTPTSVRLAFFTARPDGAGVLLAWETVSERNNVGFNLYRGTAGEDMGEQLNLELIPSEAPGEDQGAIYAFLDTTALPGVSYYYTLEDVDAWGESTPHGPVPFTLWRVYLPVVRK